MTDKDKKTEPKQADDKQPAIPASQPNTPAAPTAPVTLPETDTEDPFDFGGLPARNIKKNLGCGG